MTTVKMFIVYYYNGTLMAAILKLVVLKINTSEAAFELVHV